MPKKFKKLAPWHIQYSYLEVRKLSQVIRNYGYAEVIYKDTIFKVEQKNQSYYIIYYLDNKMTVYLYSEIKSVIRQLYGKSKDIKIREQENIGNFDEYQKQAKRTINSFHRYQVLNGALGLNGEAGEVADIIKKVYFHKHPLEEEDLILELGDVLWYVAMLCSLLGFDLSEVASKNIEKIKKRYPQGFDPKKSIERKE